MGDGINLEGRVASGGLPSFMMTVNGNRASGPVTIQASLARLVGGARIHVRGTLSACTTSAASVAANEVKIQN